MISRRSSPRVNLMKISLPLRLLIKNGVLLSNLLIVLISVFYLLNVRNGHDWGGDFSMYIMNANNIANGTPYAQTQYIYNPDTAYYGPPAYPPGFPLLLAPFISIWGINLQILKVPGILCLMGALFYINNKTLPKNFSLASRSIFLISVGFYPFFFLLSESILSDFLFLLLCFVALDRINDLLRPSVEISKNWGQYLLAGLWIYLAYSTRSVGLVLLPVAFLLAWLRYKKITRSLVVILSVPLMLIVMQSLLIPQTGAYFDQFPKSFSELIQTLLVSMWFYF